MRFDLPSSPGTEGPSATLGEEFLIRVLGTEEFSVTCSLPKLAGRRLVGRLSAPVPVEACIEIDCDDALLLGEVLGIWREGSSIFGAIEIQQALVGLDELKAIRNSLEEGSHRAARRRSA